MSSADPTPSRGLALRDKVYGGGGMSFADPTPSRWRALRDKVYGGGGMSSADPTLSRWLALRDKVYGGGGIRTHKPFRAPVFKTGAIAVLPPLQMTSCRGNNLSAGGR